MYKDVLRTSRTFLANGPVSLSVYIPGGHAAGISARLECSFFYVNAAETTAVNI